MIQVKNIFTLGLDARHHKRTLGETGRWVGGNPFLELRPRFNEQNRSNLLSSFLPEERLTDEVQRGIDVLATEKWKTMTDEDKLSSMNYFLELSAYDGVNIEVRRDAGQWTSSIIYIPSSNDMYLGVKINLELSNSGAFEIKVLGGTDWEEDMVDWETLPGFQHIPQWNVQDWGAITTLARDHEDEQKEKWQNLMFRLKPRFFIAQPIDEFREDLPRRLLLGFMSETSFQFESDFNILELNPIPFRLEAGNQVGRSSFFQANTLPPNTTNKTIDDITNALARGEPNLLLYGPPGTGKTYLCQEIRNSMKQNSRNLFIDEDSAEMRFGLPNAKTWWVTFHQSVTYEDFVLGLRPKVGEEGGMELVPRAGPLLEAMEYAKGNNGTNHSVIFIDEINRGDLSRILGDFITYMDVDKRGVVINDEVAEGDKTLPLRFALLDPNEGDRNSSEKILINGEELEDGIKLTDGNYIVPPNLTIIATMNSLDRSVAPMDSAMKRRFFQINILPDPDAVEEMMEANGAPEWLIYLTQRLMNRLNDWLRRVFNNDDIQIGHSYFAKVSSINDLVDTWERRILPLLLDLCRSTTKREKLERLLQWREDDTSWNNAMEFASEQEFNVLERTEWPYKNDALIRSGQLSGFMDSEEKLVSFFYLLCEPKGGM